MKKLFPFLLLIISFELSAQSGINWGMGMNISTNNYSNMHPKLSLDAIGNPLVIWGRMSDESVFFSRWDGTMFTAPVKLNGALTVVSTTWMGPDIASHGDTVYVVMKQTPESDTASHIYMVHSYNGGISFSSPIRVDYIGDSISRFPTVTTNEIGNPVVAFMKLNNSFGESRWVVTKSSDYGNTFSIDVKASGWGGSTEICDCCPGEIVADENSIAMLYRNNNNNIRDTWMGVSNNNGTSFTNGCNIDNNNWNINACPSTGPDGIIIGDSLYAVYMNGAGGLSKVYRSISSLSNAAFQSAQPITGNFSGLSLQNYPRIASNGNALAIVWKQTVNGNTELPILFTNDIANGFPAQYDTVDLSDITNADVAISNGKIFVIWEDDNSATVKYRTGTFMPVTTLVNETIASNLFSITPNPANNYLNILLNAVAAKLTITDLFGKQILTQEIQTNFQLNISEFNSGIYFVTVQSGNSNFTQKFIKF